MSSSEKEEKLYDENLCVDIEDEENRKKTWDSVYYNNTIKQLSKIYSSLNENNSVRQSEKIQTESIDEATERLKLDSEAIHSYTANVEADIELKKKYATWFIVIFVIQLLAFNVIFILVGARVLKFTENTLNIFIVGGFAEIISLITIIIKYLFRDNFSKSLSDILEKNKTDK